MFFSYKPGKFATQVIHGVVAFASVCGIILSLTVVGLAIWSFRHSGSSLLEDILQLGVYGSVVWGFICLWGVNRSGRELGAQVTPKFYTGPRPDDADELRVWIWGRRFVSAFLLIILCMALLTLSVWLRNE